jgi:hypothetical protein
VKSAISELLLTCHSERSAETQSPEFLPSAEIPCCARNDYIRDAIDFAAADCI